MKVFVVFSSSKEILGVYSDESAAYEHSLYFDGSFYKDYEVSEFFIKPSNYFLKVVRLSDNELVEFIEGSFSDVMCKYGRYYLKNCHSKNFEDGDCYCKFTNSDGSFYVSYGKMSF